MKQRYHTIKILAAGIVLLLFLARVLPAHGAAGKEDRAWESAVTDWNIGQWARAEAGFAKFLEDYDKSDRYADAVLMQAQARYKLAEKKEVQPQTKKPWTFSDVVQVLDAHQDRAGDKADYFEYYRAKADYAGSNYSSAVVRFERVARDFPVSSWRAEAAYSAAWTLTLLGERTRAIKELSEPNGVFRQMANANPTNDWIVDGLFLLSGMELEQTNYAGAEEALKLLAGQKLKVDDDWKRQELLCRTKLQAGKPEEALAFATNLLQAAISAVGNPGQPRWTADSISLLGETYRRLDRQSEAVATYTTNLASSFPERQREALVNIVELNLRQGMTANAMKVLDDFLAKNQKDKNSDFAALMLGELQLKQYYDTSPEKPAFAQTNLLNPAASNFDTVIKYYTNSQYLGQAYLNAGWCFWAKTNLGDAEAAFGNAVARLGPGEHQAVALFKLGDTLYLKKDYSGAIASYSQIIDRYASVPAVKDNLFERCLYQMLRAGVESTNLAVASNALSRIFEWFPDGLLGEPGTLLLGQAVSRRGNAAEARKLFSDADERWPESPLRPQIELAIARTYERQDDWTNAIRIYENWIGRNTNSSALPEAEFSRALAEFRAGEETNAFKHMTNFVETFRTNELAASALNWIGDYQWAHGEYENAEMSYKRVFSDKDRPPSDRRYHARMMAGRSAVMNRTWTDAMVYFTNLANDPTCPPELALQAQFACGDAYMASQITNRYDLAINRYTAVTARTNTVLAALAWGRLGDCYQQLAAQSTVPADQQTQLQQAANAYRTVMQSPLADLDARCLAEQGLGMTLTALARLEPPDSSKRRELLEGVDGTGGAKGAYLDIVAGHNLRPDEKLLVGHIREAALAAGKLMEDLGEWDEALQLYQGLSQNDDLRQLKTFFNQRIENAQKHLPAK